MSIFTFDDEYKGARWTYGVTLRPIARFNIPDGFIIDSDRENDPRFIYGTVDYPFRLADDVASHYDMVLVKEPDREQSDD